MRLDAVEQLGLQGEERVAGLVTGAGYPDSLALVVTACADLEGPVCDVGAGLGAASVWLAQQAAVEVVAVEPEERTARLAGRAFGDLATMVAVADAVPWRSGTAAATTFLGAVSLLDDLARPLAEAARILRPGGVLAIADLAAVGRRHLRTGDNHFRSADELADLIDDRGFEVEEIWRAPANLATSWDATIERVDDEVARRHGGSAAFDAWRRDRDHLGDLIGDGAVELVTLVATRQGR